MVRGVEHRAVVRCRLSHLEVSPDSGRLPVLLLLEVVHVRLQLGPHQLQVLCRGTEHRTVTPTEHRTVTPTEHREH